MAAFDMRVMGFINMTDDELHVAHKIARTRLREARAKTAVLFVRNRLLYVLAYVALLAAISLLTWVIARVVGATGNAFIVYAVLASLVPATIMFKAPWLDGVAMSEAAWRGEAATQKATMAAARRHIDDRARGAESAVDPLHGRGADDRPMADA